MPDFIIKPWLGLRTNVPANDPSMFQMIGDNAAITHAAGGVNFRLRDPRNATSKAPGRTQYSNSAAGTTNCLGMFQLDDGDNVTHWLFMGDGSSQGRIYRYDASRDPTRISDVAGHAGAVEFAYDALDLYSVIRFGNYMIFADNGEHTPYKSDHNDTTLTKLIQSGTEYKFKYLESFQNRIIGAYSDQTNGDLEIRWTDALPTWGSLTMASGNQLYVPSDDPITGIRRMGKNVCFVYSDTSINRLDYYPNYTKPFGFATVVNSQGAVNHHSIVDVGGMHFLFNRYYGFVSYTGGTAFPVEVISEQIEDEVAAINQNYYGHIVGTYIPQSYEIAWTVPANGSDVPSQIWFYNLNTKQWRFEDKNARYIDSWRIFTNITWSDLSGLGYSTWQDMIDAGLKWNDFFTSSDRLVMSHEDGQTYYNTGNSDVGEDYEGYRIEPIMDFGRPGLRDLLTEIWIWRDTIESVTLDVYYRGGDSVGDVEQSNWEKLNTVAYNVTSANIATTWVCYPAKSNIYHQIRYGSVYKNMPWTINQIRFVYTPEGPY